MQYPRRGRTLREVTEHHHAPDARPVQSITLKSGAAFANKTLWKQPTQNRLSQTFFDEGRERARHPSLHRKDKARLGPEINRWRKQVPTRFHEEAFYAAILQLRCFGKSEDIFDQFMIKEWDAQFQ